MMRLNHHINDEFKQEHKISRNENVGKYIKQL